MPRITLDLLRRRSEHNDGILSTLEEITLHQQDLEAIELVGDACRNLQILYLQNNLIRKIENLFHLKQLWYLNLAINSIEVIENLEGCESLKKLDLTLNFIRDLTCVRNLRKNVKLEQLYLTGNPCTETEGYRPFVIQLLPHLVSLDGADVKKSEVIRAQQDADPVYETWRQEALAAAKEKEEYEGKKKHGALPPPTYNDEGERLYGNSPDDRQACYEDMQKKINEAKNPPKDPNSISAVWEETERMMNPKKLTPQQEIEKWGRVLQKNEGKIEYKMWEDATNVYLECHPGKFISTASIVVDIQPEYARVEVKGKTLQLLLPSEVAPSRSSVKRGQAKGELLLTMPIVGDFKGVTDLTLQKNRLQKQQQAADDGAAAEKPKELKKPAKDALLEFEKKVVDPYANKVQNSDGTLRDAKRSDRIEELD
ncbi:Protein tilB-like protein [Diplonema papillatum]|nr:Protein tilB-like protein [Diplonema papillatum]